MLDKKKYHTIHVQIPRRISPQLRAAALLGGKRHLAHLMLDLVTEWYERTHKPSRRPRGELIGNLMKEGS